MHSGPDGSLESESTGGHSGMNKTRQKVTRPLLLEGDDRRHQKSSLERVTGAKGKKTFNSRKLK